MVAFKLLLRDPIRGQFDQLLLRDARVMPISQEGVLLIDQVAMALR